MRAGLLGPYEDSLRTADPLGLVDAHGRVLPLDVARWLAPVDRADQSVLERCRGPVLDVGCGPGRVVRALSARGIPALGVDIAHTAVRLARHGGGAALRRDVFEPLPGEGHWPTVLLLDGNIGIGGDVARLLSRLADLVATGGRLIVETDPTECDERLAVRFYRAGSPVGAPFAWARVGTRGLRVHALGVGLRVVETWQDDGRAFCELRSRTAVPGSWAHGGSR